ncbi:FUSC family protein [Rhizosaccharibacter radicis]|uniref:FUSC family protein n=1 Tax=Rhizosaccharibacter radicis TaxID=2782605 RepID=A0ABT1W160_9PROT|nr:FUSC family protein [Acetobacteraceae bacterium KSS12]
MDSASASSSSRIARLHDWLGGFRLSSLGPELRQTTRILAAVLATEIVARLLRLNEPYWALITAVIVTQARMGQTLEAGRDQVVGTLVGAAAGAVAISLSLLGWPRWPVFAGLLVPLAFLAALKPNLRLAGVTLVVVFLFPAAGGPFSRPIDRVLAILTGAVVPLGMSFLVFHSRARQLAFQCAGELIGTLQATRKEILSRRVPVAEVETLNDRSSDALRALIGAVTEARREQFSAVEKTDPLLVRLVPMLRRLQSDILFVARALADDGVHAPVPGQDPMFEPVSNALAAVLDAVRTALDEEARSRRHHWSEAARRAVELERAVAFLGDRAGPLARFTLEMLARDTADLAVALKPERRHRR